MALMPPPRKPRLDPSIFNLPVEKMKTGYYSDKYFVRARDLLLKDKHRPCVTMQVFGKAHAYLGWIHPFLTNEFEMGRIWEIVSCVYEFIIPVFPQNFH